MATFTGPKLTRYVSTSSASQKGWSVVGTDNRVSGETDPCSGAVTFEGALIHAHSRGARLPTLDEVLSGSMQGTGCGYDAQYIWTITMENDDPNTRYVCWGRPANNNPPGGVMYYTVDISTTAYVRMIADVDLNRSDAVLIYDKTALDLIYKNGYNL